jgi:branched-chain amino acid transport system ATP-binding protein
MLALQNVDCFYGQVQVLRGVTLEIRAGEVLCLLGRNGAGKTTLLKAIMGFVHPARGRIMLDDVQLSALPAHAVPKQGVAYVPQGRRLFAELTVRENLEIGLMTRGTGQTALARVLDLFPILRERLGQRAGSLSGGEQQMLAMARALCIEPRVLLLDEPTEGLMPSMIATIRDSVRQLRDAGVAILLVEQRVEAVLPLADRVAFLETGHLRVILGAEELRADRSLLLRYVGVSI